MSVIYLLLPVFIIFVIAVIFLLKKYMEKTFKSLSFDVMEKNQSSFLQMASALLEKQRQEATRDLEKKKQNIETVLTPLKETLSILQEHNRQIEKDRKSAYGSLTQQLEDLNKSQYLLQKETKNLSSALKSPNVRGMWGQIHLRRVVELAGLLKHCDFFEQIQKTDDTIIYRPDLLIKLPQERCVVIDAKTPVEAYMEAMEEKDDFRKKEKLVKHASQVKKHIKDLGRKNYWKLFSHSLEYVILYLPAEAFFSAATEIDPHLFETAASFNVILATPTTLIAILRAIAFSWKQEAISTNAKEIAVIGKELYERLSSMNSHFARLGKSISSCVDTYNHAISSLESRVLVSARKLKEFSISSSNDEILIDEVNKTTRSIKKETEAIENK